MLLAVLVLAFVGTADEATARGGGDEIATIELSGLVSVQEIADLEQQVGVTILEYVFEFQTSGETWTAGVTRLGTDGTNDGTRVALSGMFADIEADTVAELGELVRPVRGERRGDPAFVAAGRSALSDVQEVLDQLESHDELGISRIVVEGPTANIEALRLAVGTPVAVSIGGQELPTLAINELCESWWPVDGSITTAYSSVQPERYVRQRLWWSQASVASIDQTCSWLSTYEAESVFNNYDDLTFFSDDVTSWSSNLPDAYKDVTAFDNNNELQLTLGTPDLPDVAASTWYSTYMRTEPGNWNVDRAKVQGQLGHHIAGCESPWCVFADETRRLISPWLHIVPGVSYW